MFLAVHKLATCPDTLTKLSPDAMHLVFFETALVDVVACLARHPAKVVQLLMLLLPFAAAAIAYLLAVAMLRPLVEFTYGHMTIFNFAHTKTV